MQTQKYFYEMVAYCLNDDGDYYRSLHYHFFALPPLSISVDKFHYHDYISLTMLLSLQSCVACYVCANNRTFPISLKRLPRVKCLSWTFVVVIVVCSQHHERASDGKYEKHATNLIGQTFPIKITGGKS